MITSLIALLLSTELYLLVHTHICHQPKERQLELKSILYEQEESSMSQDALTILLHKKICEDNNASFRRVALSVSQVPIETLRHELSYVDG